MNNFNLTTFLTTNINIEKQYIEQLLEKCRLKSYEKGAFLLQEGDYCENSFFVEKGLLRQFFIDHKGKEHLIQFAPENWFITDIESYYFNQPSKYYIQALEYTQVFLLNEVFFHQLAQKNKYFEEFNKKILHNSIRYFQNRVRLLLSTSAEERYLEFVKLCPDILLRVPQIMVASYLGITPESLSRIRKELAVKYSKK